MRLYITRRTAHLDNFTCSVFAETISTDHTTQRQITVILVSKNLEWMRKEAV